MFAHTDGMIFLTASNSSVRDKTLTSADIVHDCWTQSGLFGLQVEPILDDWLNQSQRYFENKFGVILGPFPNQSFLCPCLILTLYQKRRQIIFYSTKLMSTESDLGFNSSCRFDERQ